ncbi:MAG TPA: amidohydrolase family protein [Terracidiphilus sp.]|nr:amidohydrolase family protein [Terracidiphilus sp.]
MNRSILIGFVVATLPIASQLASQQKPSPLAPYISVTASVLVLQHATLIDGTGSAPQMDMRIDIAGDKIIAVQPSNSSVPLPYGAKVLDLTGKTVIPGLVGMHEHLFYPMPERPDAGNALYGEMADSAPRLYLAGGVTTARTAGSVEPYTDLELKKQIDAGLIPGPNLDVTGPYLEGKGTFALQMRQLADADDAARTVEYWAAEGVTSFKAYNYITSDELRMAIRHAHFHGLKITGHLCSIGFKEAAELGIDNLEHGIVVDTEFYPGKQPDVCPDAGAAERDLENNVNMTGPDVTSMILDLVQHHVAVTSTLAVLETFMPNRPSMTFESPVLKTLTPEAVRSYLETRMRIADRAANPDVLERGAPSKILKLEMQFEREFVAAGGLLMAGCDPTGYGGVVPGFGDQRNIELLVEAGFTPVEAIQIATLNGAKYMRKDTAIGSIAPGKTADLVVLDGNPAENIANIEKVDTVFKDGVGYDPAKLIQSVTGLVGLR